MKTTTVGDKGPRVLLVHGNDLAGPFYMPLADALAREGVRTTLVTLPGFDGEPPLPSPSWAGLVELLREACGGDDPPQVLAGHSMGALLALLVAARAPPALRGLALLEPAIFPARVVARVAAWRYLRRVVNAESDRFDNYNGGLHRIAHLDRYPRAAIELHLATRQRGDRETGRALFQSMPALYPLPFDAVRVPTLLVTGADAGPLGRVIAASIRRQLRPEHVVIRGAAHWLAHEADEAVAAAIAPFARKVAR